jgi:hypothetical protein
MPQSKPTQVIAFRIELQTSERRMLEEYLQNKATTDYINSAIKATGPIAIGAGIAGGIWLGVKAWAGVQAALLGPVEDAKEYVEKLFAPYDEERDGIGNLRDVRDDVSESGNIYTEVFKNDTVRDWVFSPTISRLFPKNKAVRAFDRASDDFFSALFD